MKFTINKEYSKSIIKAARNSEKTCQKFTKTSKRNDRHCFGIPVVKFGQVPHPVHSVHPMLLVYISGETKRSILNVNLKKYPRQIQHPVIDAK